MKLPVFKALATTFAFVLENWTRLLRIVWLPFLLMFGASYWFQTHVFSRTEELLARGNSLDYRDVQAFTAEVWWQGMSVNIFVALVGLMVTAGILRLVIRGQNPSLPFYLRWGNDEWALLGTSVVLFAAMFLILFMGGFVIALVAAVGGGRVLMMIILGCLFLWLMVRCYLSFPAAIGQEQIGLVPAWEASSGQFWQLLGYLLLLALLGIVFQIAVMAVVTPQVLAVLIDLYTFKIHSTVAQERMQEAMAIGTVEGAVRMIAIWVLGAVPTVVGTVALGVAWRMIDENTRRPKTPAGGSASSVMGF